jgi:hypothetical protein
MKGGQRRIQRRLSRRGVKMIIPCLVLTVAMSVVSSAAFSETWSCERPAGRDKTEQMKWVVSGDQMRAFRPAHPSGVAFSHVSSDAAVYFIIDKTSGTLIEIYDLGRDFDKPDVDIGHCVQTVP